MNILILSAGTRNKIVEYFVKTLSGNGKVVATDMSKLGNMAEIRAEKLKNENSNK